MSQMNKSSIKETRQNDKKCRCCKNKIETSDPVKYINNKGLKTKNYVCYNCINQSVGKYKYCDECKGIYDTQVCTRCIRYEKLYCSGCSELITLEDKDETTCKNKKIYHKACIVNCVKCNEIIVGQNHKTSIGPLCDGCKQKLMVVSCNVCGSVSFPLADSFAAMTHSKGCASKAMLNPDYPGYPCKDGPFDWDNKFGIEVEYIGHKVKLPGWETQFDRSCGWEFVSSCLDQDSKGHIKQLVETVKGVVMTNELCAFHMHVAADHFTWLDVQNLCRNFVKIKPWIFEHQPRYRSKTIMNPNTYKTYNTTNICANESKILVAKDSFNFWNSYYGGLQLHKVKERRAEVRYSPLNIHSYFYRGTIEFRFSASFLNYDWICANINLCMKLFNYKGGLSSIYNILSPTEISYWNSLRDERFRSLIRC